MNHNGTTRQELAPLARRSNGLSPEAPDPGRLILVTGGGGYIGSVLTERLLDRGYRVRILDRLYWGRKPLARVIDRVEIVEADVREMPADRARRGRRRDPPRRPLERSDRGVRPRGELADERHRHRDAGAQLHRPRRGAPRVRLLVLALRRPAARACTTRRRRSSRAARTPHRSATARRRCCRWWATGSARSSCATARSTATARACASTWWSTRSSRTRCSGARSRCTAVAGCGGRSSTSRTSPTR